ncbi:DUF456 domain-containing protein [Neobacillus thermocopriae]|uniref:DUF456 domain-containing protein n=1 Tax=Neobacillus thermocopriae TaxID=1215031 RepID=UPI0030840C5C
MFTIDILFWILIIGCFILSFVGLLYPIIPSVLVIWAGVGIYHFGINSNEISWITVTMLVILTILLFLADYLANQHFVEKAGATQWGNRAAAIGLIVGSFVIPPFGVIIIPFAFVLIAEMLQKKSFQESFKVAFATFIAFLSGTLAKAVVQLIMIIVFFVDVAI